MVSVADKMIPVSEALETAIRLQRAGDLQRAEAIYRSILALQPDHSDALHLLGAVLLLRSNHATAVDLINQAIARRPGIAMYHFNLGKAYRAMNRFEDALAQFRRAFELDPDMLDALYNCGETVRWLGKEDEAIEVFDKVTSLRPTYSIAYVRKGEILQKRGRAEEALGCYQQAIASGPDKAGIYVEIGNAFAAMGRRDKELKYYERAVALRPSLGVAQLHLAKMYRQEGRLREAVDCCRRMLAVDPDDVYARHMLHALEGEHIERATPEYVRQLFDHNAADFDQVLLKKLSYRIPGMLSVILRQYRHESAGALDILDLGCGTGLMGLELRDISRRLVGIDLSSNMLHLAKARGVYDELLEGDIVEHMARFAPSSYDVVVSADVFVYLGNLATVFEHCRRILRPGGLFAFSVERLSDDTKDYVLDVTQRFKHSDRYVQGLCAHSGFSLVHRELVQVRTERGEPVGGRVYLLSKS